MRGKFIVIEGLDGTGKSTQAELLVDWLRDQGLAVLHTREPGGSKRAEQIRSLVLSDVIEDPLTAASETLLMVAARVEHIHKTILPALARGEVVLCDRFTDSTYAYQGRLKGETELVLQLQRYTDQLVKPDVTIFLDLPVTEATARLVGRGTLDRFDRACDEHRLTMRKAYLDRISEDTSRWLLISAQGERYEVSRRLIQALTKRFKIQKE